MSTHPHARPRKSTHRPTPLAPVLHPESESTGLLRRQYRMIQNSPVSRRLNASRVNVKSISSRRSKRKAPRRRALHLASIPFPDMYAHNDGDTRRLWDDRQHTHRRRQQRWTDLLFEVGSNTSPTIPGILPALHLRAVKLPVGLLGFASPGVVTQTSSLHHNT
ncbi:hypothetical protein DFP72DRAFT_897333, partial [Ephemerocybe angulata]